MSDVNSNININIDASDALTTIKNLQRQISLFHQEMARSGTAANQAAARGLQNSLMQNINATGQFRSQIKTIQSETEHFTEQLERNKMSIGQYFRYAGASTKSFGQLWKKEFNTIEKVAVERVKTLQTQYIKLGRDANGALKSIAIRPLALDMNNFATKAAVAAQKQQLLNQLLKQGSTAMLNWGKNTQWAGRQLMVGFTIPLAMAGTAAAKAYIDFEKAAIKFKRVYGDFNTSAAETDKMADSIKNLALEYTKYGVAVTDTMNMAADAAAMGKTGVDLLKQVQQANKLAVLGNVSQSQALETTISLTNAFGIAADKLSGKIDFLNAVENQTVTSIEDLTIAIPKAAPVIQQLGGDVEDLAFFLTAMKEGGIEAGEGANALKSGLASMINPSKKASEFLEGFGINLKGIVEANSGDVAKTVYTFAKELDNLDPLNRARAIETLFGKFQFSRISTLFQNITKEGSQANEVLRMTQMTSEELAVLSEREMKKIESSPAYKFQKVLADIQAKLVPIGEAFLKAITPIIEKVGGILDGFNSMGDGAKQFATLATVAIAGIGPVALMTFGLIANGVANLIKMFASIKTFFNGTRGEAQGLGDTTEYMTQKELEAQAVASSLEQSHAKLTQQFTVQSEAIRNLVAEYERAIGAQSRMLAGMGSVGAGTPGFSSGGTVVGPGGPTSDNLIAKVSPGEEVFSNADIAPGGVMHDALAKLAAAGIDVNEPGARRRASISGNVANARKAGVSNEQINDVVTKVQEFGATTDQARTLISHLVTAAKGGPEVLTNWLQSLQENAQKVSGASELIDAQKASTGVATNKNAKQFTHATSGVEMSVEEASNLGLFDGSGNVKEAERELAKSQSGQKAQKFKLQTMFGMSNFDATTNGRLANVGVENQEFLDKYDEAGVEKWNDSIAAGGGNLEQLNQEIIKFDANIKKFIAESGQSRVFDNPEIAAKAGGGAALTDAVAYARSQASSEMVSAIDTAATTTRETRVGGGLQTVSGKFNQEAARPVLAEQWSKDMGIPLEEIKTKTTEEMTKIGNDAGQGMQDGARENLDTNSPSRKMYQIGSDGAQGLMNGAKDTFANIPGVPAPGATAPSAPNTAGIPGVPTPPPVTPQAQSGFMAKMKGVASDVTSKGLNLVATGVKKGSDAVVNAAGTALNNYMEAGYAEADRKNALRVQQQRVAADILAATDAEYMAMQAAQDAHQKQLVETNQATQEEVNAAVARSKAMQEKERALQKEIANSGQDLEVIQQRLANAQKADMVNDIEASNAQTDAANGNAPTGGTTPSQIVSGTEKEQLKSYGTIRDEWKQGGLDRKQRKEQYNKFSKAQKKEFRGGAFRSVGGGMQKAAMVGTMAAGALSMMPGPVGKMAQDATPLIGGLSMLSGLITGPVSGALVALVAVIGASVYAVMKLDEAFKNSAQQQVDLSNKLGASAGAIDALAESSGRVTGSQYMEKVNSAKAKGLFAAPGKTTFGENFMQGDTGKGMLEAAKSELATAKGDKTGVVSNLTQQLSAGIISGAVSKQQAQSIASRLAYELGDMSIAFKVNAQVDKIVGPNGEDFEKDPIQVAARMYAQNAKDRDTLMQGMNPGTLWSGGQNNEANRNTTAVGTTLGMAGVGAGAGALIGTMILPGVGTAVGAVIGTIGGAIAGAFTAIGTMEENAKKAGRAAGAVVANMTQGLEMQAQITDQLDAYYNKKLAEAAAEGDITEYKRLQLEYDEKKAALGKVNAQATEDMIAAYEGADQGGKEAMDKGLENAINTKFKDDVNAQAVLPSIMEQLKDMDQGTAFMLKGQLLNGMDPTQMTKFLAANEGGNEDQISANKTSTEALAAKGGTRLQEAMTAANGIADQEVRTKFLTEISGMDDAESKDAAQLAMQVQALGGVMENSVDTFMNYTFSENGADIRANIEEMTDELTGTKDKSFAETLDIVYEVSPELKPKNEEEALAMGEAFNQEYFDKLKSETQRDTYVSTITTTLEVMSTLTTHSQLMENDDFAAWVSEEGLSYPDGKSPIWWKRKFAEAMGQKVTETGVDLTGAAPKPKTTGGGGGGGPEAHWTDEVVKGMRDFVSPSQKLTTGINASVTALKNFKKAGDAAFNGLSNQLRKAGVSEGMLQKILEDDAKNVGRFFKNGKLTAEGLKVQARIYQQSLGAYVDSQRSAIRVSNDQGIAMRKLTAAGLSYVGASEMVQDAELAQAIARGANTKQIKAMIKAYKDAQVAAYQFNETTAEGRAKNSIDLAESQISSLEATSQRYQTGLDMIASQEQDINKTYDKRMKALDKILSINQEIADSQQDQLTLAGALSKGDIFAAAQAMAAQKSKQAQKDAEAQKQALTDARDAQVAGLTATIGGKQMTREQLEEKIKNINDQILEIKRQEIDAQNELIARKEYEAKLDIAKQARNAPAPSTGGAGGSGGSGGSGSGSGGGGGGGGAASIGPKYKAQQKVVNDLVAKKKAAQSKIDAATAAINKLKADYKKVPTTTYPIFLAAAYDEQRRKIKAQQTAKETEKGWLGRGLADYTTKLSAAQKKLDGMKKTLYRGGPANGIMSGVGSDTVPAVLTPGEFIMSAPAVKKYGKDTMRSLNEGRLQVGKTQRSEGSTKNFSPVYNINVDVAKTDANPEEIASAVMRRLTDSNNAMIRGVNG